VAPAGVAARGRRPGGVVSALWLDNGLVRLGFVPAAGGRLLSFRFAGTELLWRDTRLVSDDLDGLFLPNDGRMGDWVNYGGDKTWPAPQGWSGPGEWAGPPDPVLDSGPYTVDSTVGSVTMTSASDPRTGLRLARRFTLTGSGYTLELTATNVSGRPVRWALWNVTQFPGGGEVFVALRDHPAPVVDLIAGTGNPRYELVGGGARVPAQDVVGKLGFPGAAGSLSYERAGHRVTYTFPVVDAEYPDRGSPVEVWLEHPQPAPLAALGGLDPPAHIVECEVLGPLVELAPDDRTSLTIEVVAWGGKIGGTGTGPRLPCGR
jgi:uncharacterized protein DUF4380